VCTFTELLASQSRSLPLNWRGFLCAGKIKGMGNDLPTVAVFGFAGMSAVAAFIYIRYAEQVKRWRDDHALFEFQKQINRTFAVSTYRAIGWITAVCSALMFALAIARWVGY
jgi:hypothetical protein